LEPIIKRGFRYQTGEIKDIAEKMKKGNIPEIDIDNDEEYNSVIEDLKKYNINLMENVEVDEHAVDTVEKPEFQFRTTFYIENDKNKTAYADFFMIEPPDETYADVFGD
jgi:hypothetical protein